MNWIPPWKGKRQPSREKLNKLFSHAVRKVAMTKAWVADVEKILVEDKLLKRPSRKAKRVALIKKAIQKKEELAHYQGIVNKMPIAIKPKPLRSKLFTPPIAGEKRGEVYPHDISASTYRGSRTHDPYRLPFKVEQNLDKPKTAKLAQTTGLSPKQRGQLASIFDLGKQPVQINNVMKEALENALPPEKVKVEHRNISLSRQVKSIRPLVVKHDEEGERIERVSVLFKNKKRWTLNLQTARALDLPLKHELKPWLAKKASSFVRNEAGRMVPSTEKSNLQSSGAKVKILSYQKSTQKALGNSKGYKKTKRGALVRRSKKGKKVYKKK